MGHDENRVYPGGSATGTIQRGELVKKMKNIAAKKNIFITAPGGYGKTVAANQWLTSIRGKKAKIIIGEADNDVGVLQKKMAVTLLKLAGKSAPIPESSISFDRLIEAVKLMPEKSARCYLVIDDTHKLKNDDALKHLPVLLKRLPNYVRICLISRAEPSAALMKTGLFELITQTDLLFTASEIGWLGAEKEYELSSEQVNDLLKTTGGWAMYLSALLSEGKTLYEGQEGKIPLTLKQYLEERVWELWNSETKTTLLCLAVPTEVTPELCERLTGQDNGCGVLEHLLKNENAFLSHMGADAYRFHDVFHDFLLEHINGFLGKDKVRELNDIAAGWYYEQGDYYSGARHYINKGDHGGINRCLDATNHYWKGTSSISVESRLHFFKQCRSLLTPKFIGGNPYLMSKFAVAAYHDGNTGEMLRYLDDLNKKMNEEPGHYPELLLTAAYINGLDFRRPMRDFCKMQAALMSKTAAPKSAAELRTGTITQNMPFYHRSMRDFSEYHELLDNDLATFREVGKIMLSDALNIAEKTLVAGILYERGELLETIRQAPNAYNACTDETHPETVFSAHMMLSAVLYAMGAFREADEVMKKMETYIEKKAGFLRPNFKALQTERAIRAGNIEAAREWLEVNAYHLPGHLPFYQICRHFTTLRSYIAIGDFETAIGFGRRLLTLAMEYNRPLDQIESGLLTAIVLWKGNKQDEAVNQIKTAISTAMPYGFTQLFINEGKELLPLFWALREKVKKSDGIIDFTNKLTDAISKKYNLQSESDKKIKLTAQQHTMLTCLSKDMSYAEIADATGIERSTVKYHTKQMYKRLGVHTAQEALIKAKMLGLLD